MRDQSKRSLFVPRREYKLLLSATLLCQPYEGFIKRAQQEGRRCDLRSHNHPSGELQPSEANLWTHEQLTEAGKILGLRVLDHVIVTRKGHYSFQEAGLIRC